MLQSKVSSSERCDSSELRTEYPFAAYTQAPTPDSTLGTGGSLTLVVMKNVAVVGESSSERRSSSKLRTD